MKRIVIFAILLCFAKYQLFSQTPQTDLYWAGELKSSSLSEVLCLDFDQQDNLFVGGYYIDQTDFDLSPDGVRMGKIGHGADAFVAKYTESGALLWHRSINMESVQEISALKTDFSGAVFCVGNVEGSGDLDPDPNRSQNFRARGYSDVFAMKLSPDGSTEWITPLVRDGMDKVFDMALDEEGNLYLCGYFMDSRSSDPKYRETYFPPDLFMVKLDRNGRQVWERRFPAGRGGGIRGIDLDADGNIFIAGNFRSYLDLGQSTSGNTLRLTANQESEIFLARLNPAGIVDWGLSFGGKINDQAEAVAVHPDGHVFVSGFFNSNPTDFDPSPHRTEIRRDKGMYDAFLVRFSAEGQLDWVNTIGGEAWDNIFDIHLLPNGDPLVCGIYTSSADFDPSSASEYILKSKKPQENAFVARYDGSDGHFHWARAVGGDERETLAALTFSPTGLIAAGGTFWGYAQVAYGQGNQVSLGKTDSHRRQGLLITLFETNGTVND